MSIYIQIATIEDLGILETVESALLSADFPQQVHIGIAATVSQEFYEETIYPLTNYSNVNAKRFDPFRDRGLGKGRINSRFAYNDQDYILQVDAHTLFQSGWDTYLINMLSEAIEETGNSKTLVTAYLGKYKLVGDSAHVIDDLTGYPVWPENNVTDMVPLKSCAVVSIKDFPDFVLTDKTKKFYPANRVSGNFIFGNRYWGEYHGWSGKEMFWEEEVLPAVSLLDNGFSLVFTNQRLPLTHKYWGDDLKRQVLDSLFNEAEEIDRAAIDYINEFVYNNQEACDLYREYSGYDISTNTLTYKVVVPKTYEFRRII